MVTLPEELYAPTRFTSMAKQRVAEAVVDMIRRMETTNSRWDRRTENRIPFPYPMFLTPQVTQSGPTESDAMMVIGRDISYSGLRFYHHEPLEFQSATIQLAQDNQSEQQLLLKLKWCRFIHAGWYESGGQLVRLLTECE